MKIKVINNYFKLFVLGSKFYPKDQCLYRIELAWDFRLGYLRKANEGGDHFSVINLISWGKL